MIDATNGTASANTNEPRNPLRAMADRAYWVSAMARAASELWESDDLNRRNTASQLTDAAAHFADELAQALDTAASAAVEPPPC